MTELLSAIPPEAQPFVPSSLSTLAQNMLQKKGRPRQKSRYESRQQLANTLESRGIVLTATIIEFEERFGGLEFSAAGQKYTLGIWVPSDPAEENGDEDCLEPGTLGLVRCGTYFSGMYELWIDAGGAIYAAYSQIWKRSTSAAKLIEQLAMLDHASEHEFTVRIHPPLGASFANALHLELIVAATDECETWWSNNELVTLQAHTPNDARSDATFVFAKRVIDVAQVIESSQSLCASCGFALSARNKKKAQNADGQDLQHLVDGQGWPQRKDAKRFFYDDGRGATGDVWVLKQTDQAQIEQCRIHNGRVRQWDTFRDESSITRLW